MADLSQNHLTDALTHAGSRGTDVDLAVLNAQQDTADILLTHTSARVLEATGDTSIGVGVVDVLNGFDTSQHIGVGVSGLTVGHHIAGLDGITTADFPCVDTDHLSQQVDVHFGCEAALADTEATICTRNNVVGVNRHTEDVDILVVVGTSGMSTCTMQDGAAQGSVSAGISDDNALHAGQDAVLVTGSGELHLHGMTLNMVVQGFLTGELDLDGTLGMPCHQDSVLLDGHIFLTAEAAADQGCTGVDLLSGNVQHDGTFSLNVVDGLAGGVNQDAVLALGHRHGALGLHEAMLLPGGLILTGDNILGVLDGLVSVATNQVCTAHDVAVGVDQGSIALQSVIRIGDGLQNLVVDLDQSSDLVHLFLVLGGDDGNDVADITGDITLAHHNVPVVLDVTDLVDGNISLGQNLHAVGVRFCLGGVNTGDQSTGVLGVDGLCVQHTVDADIVSEDAGAVDLLSGVDTLGVLIHVQGLGSSRDLLLLTEELSSHQDGVFDLLVAGAAAEVALDGFLDFLTGGSQIDVQQALGRDDHAGDAEAALNSASLGEAVLVDLHFLSRNALDGEDLLAFQFAQRRNASLGLLAIDQNGTGTAGTFTAAVLGCSQAQVVTEEGQKLLVVVSYIVLAVNIDGKHIATSFHIWNLCPIVV